MTKLAEGALRVAAVWGTTVVALRTLVKGESFDMGDDPTTKCRIPDGIDMSSMPLRAVGPGWELDARGALTGLLTLRGRMEDPAALARAGAPMAILPGDYGLVQYGQFSIFFQFTDSPTAMAGRRFPEVLALLALFCSAILHLGLLGVLRTLMTPAGLPKPLELSNPDEVAARFGLKRAVAEALQEPASAGDKDKGGGEKKAENPEKKAAPAGKKIKGPEGKMGLADKGDRTELPGEARPTTHYGGLSEILEGSTGKEIQNTLRSIQTVSSALSGLRSNDVVLGGGFGTGLKGAGTGGGGTGAGVAFGAGQLDTGFGGGAGRGGTGGGNGRGGGGGGGNGGGGRAPTEAKVAVSGGAATAQGGLSPEQIRRVVMAHIGAVRACYETEAQRNPSLHGGLTVAWQIDPTGKVSGANIAGTTLNNARVEGCVSRQVKGWRFPASDRATQVAGFPFKFGIGG